MRKLFIRLIFIISPFLMWSHNPLSAKYYLELGENVSLLTINLSQDGVDQALLKDNTLEYLESLNQKQFEELIVGYIKTNFNLSIDGVKIELKKGGIKMGSHQTDLKFVLPSFSSGIKNISVHIPAFKENGKHQTIFLYNIYGYKNKIILSEDNQYKAEIDTLQTKNISNILLLYVVLGVLILIPVALYSKKLLANKS